MHARIDLDRLYKSYFGLDKDWSMKLYDLLISHNRISRKQIEVISPRKYFMRDQIDRLVTLHILVIVGRDAKGKPVLLKSNLYREEKKDDET